MNVFYYCLVLSCYIFLATCWAFYILSSTFISHYIIEGKAFHQIKMHCIVIMLQFKQTPDTHVQNLKSMAFTGEKQRLISFPKSDIVLAR